MTMQTPVAVSLYDYGVPLQPPSLPPSCPFVHSPGPFSSVSGCTFRFFVRAVNPVLQLHPTFSSPQDKGSICSLTQDESIIAHFCDSLNWSIICGVDCIKSIQEYQQVLDFTDARFPDPLLRPPAKSRQLKLCRWCFI